MATNYYETAVQEMIDFGDGTASKRNPAGGSHTGTQVNLSSLAIGQKATTSVWDPGSVANGAKVSTTITVVGAALGDHTRVSFTLDLQELTLTSYVSASNTVEIVLGNLTGAAVDLGSGTLSVLVFEIR